MKGTDNMSILKIKKKTNPYVMLDKSLLEDKSLSWKAKGLLSYLLSRPEDWKVKVKHLVNQSTDGRDAVYSILKELRNAGYIQLNVSRDGNGKVTENIYDVYEKPVKNPLPENPEVDSELSPLTENPDAVNPDSVKPNSEKPESLLNKEKTNKRHDKRMTAAAAKETSATKNNNDNKKQTTAAASTQLNKNDYVINYTQGLTQGQRNMIESMMSSINPNQNNEELVKQVETTLLDPRSFQKTGDDFMHKLNAITKQIREGGWTPSAQYFKEQSKQARQADNERKRLYQELKSQYNASYEFYQLETQNGNDELAKHFAKELEQIKEKLHSFESNKENNHAES